MAKNNFLKILQNKDKRTEQETLNVVKTWLANKDNTLKKKGDQNNLIDIEQAKKYLKQAKRNFTNDEFLTRQADVLKSLKNKK